MRLSLASLILSLSYLCFSDIFYPTTPSKGGLYNYESYTFFPLLRCTAETRRPISMTLATIDYSHLASNTEVLKMVVFFKIKSYADFIFS